MKNAILAATATLSDGDLLARINTLVRTEREITAELVAHLAALEMRPSAYLAEGYGSLFDYCTGPLHLSEDAACNRIDAARIATRFPVVLDLLADGTVTLTAVRMLKHVLTPENHEAVLQRASQRTKEQIEELIAELAPKPDVPASVRKVPVAKGTGTAPEVSAQTPGLLAVFGTAPASPTDRGPTEAPAGPADALATQIGEQRVPPAGEVSSLPQVSAPREPRPIVQALSPQRYRMQFTIGQDTRDRLRRVQALLRRRIPDGDPAAIFDRALHLLEEVEMKKHGFAASPKRLRNKPGGNYENRIRPGTDDAKPDAAKPSTEPSHEAAEGRAAETRSRHIPATVKRAVWWRDAGQCAFVAAAGQRCTQCTFLELHHIQPYALGGAATISNLSLRCKRHNQYEGEVVFGTRSPSKPAQDGCKPDAVATGEDQEEVPRGAARWR
jgi:hypothetical protein